MPPLIRSTAYPLIRIVAAAALASSHPGVARAQWGTANWGEFAWGEALLPVPLLGPAGVLVLAAAVAAVGWWWARNQRGKP